MRTLITVYNSIHYSLTMVHGWSFDYGVISGVMARKVVTVIGHGCISFFHIPLWDVGCLSDGPFAGLLVLHHTKKNKKTHIMHGRHTCF